MSSSQEMDLGELFGSINNNDSRKREQRNPRLTTVGEQRNPRLTTVENAELVPINSSLNLMSPIGRSNNANVFSPNQANPNQFELDLDEVEPQENRQDSQLNNRINRIMLSNDPPSELKRKLGWISISNTLQNRRDQELIRTAYQYAVNPSSANLLLADDEEQDERPRTRPRLIEGAQPTCAALMDGSENETMVKMRIIQLVKQQFINVNETSLFHETSILNNQKLLQILLELSSFASSGSLEEFQNHITLNLDTISTANFVFSYCILFFKMSLFIKKSFEEGNLSFDNDFNLETVVSKLTKLNFDLRCKNNRSEKKTDNATVVDNPFSSFLHTIEDMNVEKNVTKEKIKQANNLLKQIEDSPLFNDWVGKEKANREKIQVLKQYDEGIFGLTDYPESYHILSEDKKSILSLLFVFFHFPVQNTYMMLFGTKYSHGNCNYYKINQRQRTKQTSSMTSFKKLVGSLYKPSSSVEKTSASTASGEKKKRTNKLSYNFKDRLENESVTALDSLETMFLEAKEERNYSMIKLDVYREMYATLLVLKSSSEIYNNNRNSLTDRKIESDVKSFTHKIRVNGCFFNISSGTGTKSSLETIIYNLLSLLPNPVLSNYNFLNFIYNNWRTLDGPATLHEDNMSDLMTEEFERHKREYLLFLLGMSVF